MNAVAAFAVLLILSVFAAAAFVLAMKKKRTDAPPAAVPDPAIQKEEHLEDADPRDLVDSSPRVAELRERRDAIDESVRKRIRDRSRAVLSRGSGDGSPTGR